MAVEIVERLQALGFKVIATGGTQQFMASRGVDVEAVKKVLEGRPHCVDAILNGEVQLVVNTTDGARAIADSLSIRRSAVTKNIPHYTTMTGAAAAIEGIEALCAARLEVKPLQAYFTNSSW